MGDDSQWCWFKLQADLCPCSSASALLVDECGEQIGDCPIIKTVWAPTPHDDDTPTCDCGSGESANLPVVSGDSSCWKEGDVLPFWWFQYLEKWVTLPKEPANTSGWAVILSQPPQVVCTAVEVAGVTTCAAALVTPRKKLTVVDGCACLTTESSVVLDLPTPDLVGVPTLAIDTGDATDADDDPCTCSMATLSFPVTPMSWCAGCESDSRTETVSFPVPPENGGHFDAVTSVTISDGTNCGDVSLCTTTHGYTMTCGGLCPDDTVKSTCTNVHLFDTDDIEYVTGVSLNNITLDVTSTPTTVVTGGSVTASECSAWCTYDRASGLDWTNTVWNITLPTRQVSVVKSLVITNGQVTSVNYETLDVIDPDGTTSVTLTGGPAIVNSPSALSFSFTPTVSFTPTTTTINSVTGATTTGGTLSTTTAQKTVLICGSSNA